MALIKDFPSREPLVSAEQGVGQWLMAFRWLTWLRDLVILITAIPSVVTTVGLSAQNATVGTTAIPTDALEPGLYRATWYQRVTTAAGVSSSLTTTISWTDGGVACSYTGAAMTGNTTATTQSDGKLIRVDQASPVSYALLYASNAAAAMRFSFDLILESVSLDA